MGLHQFLLNQAFAWHTPLAAAECRLCRPGYRCRHQRDKVDAVVQCRQCGTAYPCPPLLSIALVSRFPAPWSPAGLVEAMRAAQLLDIDGPGAGKDELSLGGDGWMVPHFTAKQNTSDGSWIIRRQERGDIQTDRLADDQAFCEYLTELIRGHAFRMPIR